jgi:hypothetical protein
MAEPDVHSEGVQIVVRGNFNPAIFSPGWLLANGLIGKEESEDVRPEAIVPQVSVFEVAWLRCEVTNDRLAISTQSTQEFERLRDIAVGILSTLSHTPVALLGINRFYHLRYADAGAWHRVGDRLTPKEIWDEVLVLPGMRDLTIEAVRPDEFAGHIQVTIQPSNMVPLGVFMNHNDHFVLKTVDSQPETREEFADPELAERRSVEPSAELIPFATKILNTKWNDSMDRAWEILSKIWSLGRKGG